MESSTPVASRRITVAGVDTHYLEAGTGDVPVVCLHGNPDSAAQWLPLLEQTGRLGRVIAPDMPGFGESERPDPEVFDGSMDSQGRWFEAFLEALGIDRYALVAHDWGGLALAPASRHPERVQRLVAADVVPLTDAYKWHWIARLQWRPRGVGEVMTKVLTAPTASLLIAMQGPHRMLPKAWRKRLARNLDSGMRKAILRLYRSADPDVMKRAGERLGDLTCPSLVIWGEKDPYLGRNHAEWLAQTLGAELWIVPGAGHWCMEEDPEVFSRIADFLAA